MPINKGQRAFSLFAYQTPARARINILQFFTFSDTPHQLCSIPFSKQLSSADNMPGTMLGTETKREKGKLHS